MFGKSWVFALALAGCVAAPAPILAQDAGVSGIPRGPGSAGGLNNSVNDPSGIGNAGRIPAPPPPSMAVPVVPSAVPPVSSRLSSRVGTDREKGDPARDARIPPRVSPFIHPRLSRPRKTARFEVQHLPRLLGSQITPCLVGCIVWCKVSPRFPSLPGLTRQSIFFEDSCEDGWIRGVKPAYDAVRVVRWRIAARRPSDVTSLRNRQMARYRLHCVGASGRPVAARPTPCYAGQRDATRARDGETMALNFLKIALLAGLTILTVGVFPDRRRGAVIAIAICIAAAVVLPFRGAVKNPEKGGSDAHSGVGDLDTRGGLDGDAGLGPDL